MKGLFGMALRQTTGFVVSLMRLIGLHWAVPDFSTLSRRQKTLKVSIPYRGSDGPLHLLVDSTGMKVEGEGEWNARKHGGAKRRVWRKIHIGIDERTLEIRAAEFTTSDVGDAPLITEYGFDRSLTNFEGLGPRVLPLGNAYDGTVPEKHDLGSGNLGHGPIRWEDRSVVTAAFVADAIE